MTSNELYKKLGECPVIAAVKDEIGLESALKCESGVVFVLFGSINNISEIVSKLRQGGKTVLVHCDLIDGLASKEAAVDFLIKNARPDGIISTKQPVLKYAKAQGLVTVLRFFVIDSIAMKNIAKIKNERSIDFVEILPGLMPKITKQICSQTGKPIITGGLVSEKSDIINSLNAGACAVSSTSSEVWFL